MNAVMKSLVVLLAVGGLFVTGCSDDALLTTPETQENQNEHEPLKAALPQSLDAQLLALAEDVPGFGGMFYDEDGRLTVYLLDQAPGAEQRAPAERRAELQAALTARFGEHLLSRGGDARRGAARGEGPAGEVQVISGQYDIAQLARWRQQANRVLGASGVVFTDLAEEKNRVRIGVERGASAEDLEKALFKQGIPREAVLIEEVEPVRPVAHTLRDRIRPVQGGLQIEGNTGSSPLWYCTLGFNADRSGVRGFLTNSHCTLRQGGVEFTRFSQPGGSSNLIGYEIVDPVYSSGGSCPAGRRCRYSDAAFARYYGGVASDHGAIARVTGSGTTGGGVGSIVIDHSRPRYLILGEKPWPVVGEWLDKIGRTTGHTYGRVSNTCVDTNQAGSDITLYCQDWVENAGVNNGDSGSPVLRWSSDGYITLYGILWGGNGSNFVFSAMWNIEYELGSLVTETLI